MTKYNVISWMGLEQKNLNNVWNLLNDNVFNLYAEYIMRNPGLDEAQTGIKIAGEISIPSDMQMTPLLWQKVKKS